MPWLKKSNQIIGPQTNPESQAFVEPKWAMRCWNTNVAIGKPSLIQPRVNAYETVSNKQIIILSPPFSLPPSSSPPFPIFFVVALFPPSRRVLETKSVKSVKKKLCRKKTYSGPVFMSPVCLEKRNGSKQSSKKLISGSVLTFPVSRKRNRLKHGQMKNKSVAAVYGAVATPSELTIVTDLVKRGPLRALLDDKNKRESLTAATRHRIIKVRVCCDFCWGGVTGDMFTLALNVRLFLYCSLEPKLCLRSRTGVLQCSWFTVLVVLEAGRVVFDDSFFVCVIMASLCFSLSFSWLAVFFLFAFQFCCSFL